MTETPITDLDWSTVPSPCFVVDTRLLERNARILGRVRHEAGCKVLLALKGFAMWKAFAPFQAQLDGCTASGPIEARLAREEFGKEVHTYAPAFSAEDLAETTHWHGLIHFSFEDRDIAYLLGFVSFAR